LTATCSISSSINGLKFVNWKNSAMAKTLNSVALQEAMRLDALDR